MRCHRAAMGLILVLGVGLGATTFSCASGEDPSFGTIKTDSGVGSDAKDTGVAPKDTGKPGETSPTDDTSPPSDSSGCTSGKVCDLFPQCGCGPAENCDVTKIDGTTACGPVGTITLDQKCSATDKCAKGLSCIGSLCRPFCGADSDCTGSKKGKCGSVQGGTPPTDIPGFKVCFVECDPITPSTTCGAKTGCSFLPTGETTCAAAGTATGAAGCSSTNPTACAPGYVCLSTFDCKKWCKVGSTDCGGSTCSGFTTPVSYKGTEYGVCP